MDIQEFEALHGSVWRKGLQENWCWRDLREGMLQFTAETECVLAGSFSGFGYFRTTLFLNNPHPKTGTLPLVSDALELEQYRRWHGLLPKRFGYGERAQSEEHLQKRLLLLTDKERAEWDAKVASHQTDYATIERPYQRRQHPSVSMGDVARIGEQRWLCAGVGWRLLTADEYTTYAALPRRERQFHELCSVRQ